jgi:surfactin synthase thioesterase subunit
MTSTHLWISRPKLNSAAHLRLFCVPYAGAGASIFRGWANELPPELEVCLIQLPGRESRLRETPYRRLLLAAEDLAQVLRPYLDRPFALFGHSMGALIAFETARALRRASDRNPACLIVSGRRAPHIPDPDTPLHRLPEAAFVQGVQQRYNAIPDVILKDAELMQVFLPTLRADFAMIETYDYADDHPLDCPIVCFGGRQDHRTTQATLDAWRDLTRGPFALRMFPGSHFFLNDQRALFLRALSDELTQCLTELNGVPRA